MAKQTRKSSEKISLSRTDIPEIPVRVTVEVIVRHEYPAQYKPNNFQLAEKAKKLGCPDNKFSYSFEKENASVLFLMVEEFEEDNPNDSAEFTTCINDASPEPKIRVIGLAKENNAGGRVAITLKFLGKNVFSSPKEFILSENGFLKLNILTKLPI